MKNKQEKKKERTGNQEKRKQAEKREWKSINWKEERKGRNKKEKAHEYAGKKRHNV